LPDTSDVVGFERLRGLGRLRICEATVLESWQLQVFIVEAVLPRPYVPYRKFAC
jgi:hypothetical protein